MTLNQTISIQGFFWDWKLEWRQEMGMGNGNRNGTPEYESLISMATHHLHPYKSANCKTSTAKFLCPAQKKKYGTVGAALQ